MVTSEYVKCGRQYMYGLKTTVASDHKPLETVMCKPISSAPKRLHRIILELQRYRYDIIIVHKPGKDILVKDCLSRKHIENVKPIEDEFSDKPDVAVRHVFPTLPISDPKLAEIRNRTADDQRMQVLKHVIQTGCTSKRKECSETIMGHGNHRNELMYADGMIFKVDSIVIPKTMRQEMVMREGHFGVHEHA